MSQAWTSLGAGIATAILGFFFIGSASLYRTSLLASDEPIPGLVISGLIVAAIAVGIVVVMHLRASKSFTTGFLTTWVVAIVVGLLLGGRTMDLAYPLFTVTGSLIAAAQSLAVYAIGAMVAAQSWFLCGKTASKTS